MLVQCTKKLLDELKLEPEAPGEEEPLFSWHANLVKLNRRKAVVLTNDQNRYIIVLYGLKTKDFGNFTELVISAIQETFRYEQISESVIDQYLGTSSGIRYSKTRNRSMTARLRAACDTVQFYVDRVVQGSIIQTAMSAASSADMVWNQARGEYVNPNEEMYAHLLELTGRPIFSCRAVQMKVTLDLERHKIWRRLIVPVDYPFAALHKVIQVAFGWQDYHLHEFYVYDHNRKTESERFLCPSHPVFHREGYEPIVNLACDESAFEFADEIPIKLDYTVTLADYAYDYKSMRYVYDFGDGWRHSIEIEKATLLEDKNYAVCVDAKGITPPEDVGGTTGYEMFLRTIADEDDPDREYMLAWAESQGYGESDINLVNRRLRYQRRK